MRFVQQQQVRVTPGASSSSTPQWRPRTLAWNSSGWQHVRVMPASCSRFRKVALMRMGAHTGSDSLQQASAPYSLAVLTAGFAVPRHQQQSPTGTDSHGHSHSHSHSQNHPGPLTCVHFRPVRRCAAALRPRRAAAGAPAAAGHGCTRAQTRSRRTTRKRVPLPLQR